MTKSLNIKMNITELGFGNVNLTGSTGTPFMNMAIKCKAIKSIENFMKC
jgi:hypothetical protein